MRFDRSRRIHFRKKLSFQYLEGNAVCKAEKHFRGPKTARPAVLLANNFGVAPAHCAPSPSASPAHVGSSTPAVIRTGVPPFRQARFRNFRNRGLVIVRGV